MTPKKDPADKVKDRAAASPEVVDENVDSEKDRKQREAFVKRIAKIHDELTELQNDAHGTPHEDVWDFARSIGKQIRVGPFANVGGPDDKSPLS